jgi:hypothetical protein
VRYYLSISLTLEATLKLMIVNRLGLVYILPPY